MCRRIVGQKRVALPYVSFVKIAAMKLDVCTRQADFAAATDRDQEQIIQRCDSPLQYKAVAEDEKLRPEARAVFPPTRGSTNRAQ